MFVTDADAAELMQQRISRFGQILFVLGFVAAAGTMLVLGWPTSAETVDIEQPRLNVAISPPQADETITQTFFPRHNHLSSIEVTIVNFNPQSETIAPGVALAVFNPQGEQIATRPLDHRNVDHNEKLKLTFEPQPGSADQPFRLVLTGDEGNQMSLWGYTDNQFPGGQIVTPADATGGAEAVSLETGYRFRWRDAAGYLAAGLSRLWRPIFLSLLLIPAPGALMVSLWRPKWPLSVRWAAVWGLGLSIWPIVWLWLSLAGGRWGAITLWLVIGACWGVVLWRQRWREISREEWLEAAGWVAFCGLILALRIIAVRDAVVLPWVDASRHALITEVMRRSGQMLFEYGPLLDVTVSPYHTGVHTLTAGVLLIGGDAVELHTTLLGVMQLLSTMICLALYGAGWWLTGDRWVGWSAGFLAGLPFFFPGYYSTWGRLTQLGGLVVLAVVIGLMWRFFEQERSGKRPDRFLRSAIVLSSAALFLLHARVFLFFLIWPVLIGAASWLYLRWRDRKWAWRWIGLGVMIAGATFALVAPKLWMISAGTPDFYQLPGNTAFYQGYNRFPSGYLSTGWESEFWIGAAVVSGLALLTAVRLRKDREMILVLLGLGAWGGVTWLLVAGENITVGWPILLPNMTTNSLYISLFVPLALGLSAGAVWLSRRLSEWHWILQIVVFVAWGAWIAAAGGFGATRQVDILNETTLLVRENDLDGLKWIEENVPPEATVGHSAWLWLGGTWAGSDGGAWILPLTGRASSTPPIDHVYSKALRVQTSRFNEEAQAVPNWSTVEAADFLRDAGIDYLFVGERGGFLDPAELIDNPEVELVYDGAPVYVFQVDVSE